MEWLNVDWIVANWIPLTIFAVAGFLIGWLLTGLPASRQATAAKAKVTELDARASKAEGDLAIMKLESETLKTNLASMQTERDEAVARVSSLEDAVGELDQERTDLEAILAEQEADAAVNEEEGKAEQAALEEQLAAETALAADLMEANAEAAEAMAAEAKAAEAKAAEAKAAETRADDKMGAALMAAGFGAVARQIEPVSPYNSKDIALSEAYARVLELQRDLSDRDQALGQRDNELEAAKAELQVAQAARQELESRLIRSREDVASELAVLASTMIKMKEDALMRSEARAQALAVEIDSLRAAAQQATATAE